MINSLARFRTLLFCFFSIQRSQRGKVDCQLTTKKYTKRQLTTISAPLDSIWVGTEYNGYVTSAFSHRKFTAFCFVGPFMTPFKVKVFKSPIESSKLVAQVGTEGEGFYEIRKTNGIQSKLPLRCFC